MFFSEVCELLNTTLERNSDGYEKQVVTSRSEAFCEEKSVTVDEFYKSSAEGNEVKLILVLKQVDYDSQQYVEYHNVKYKVKRTFKPNAEDIELHIITAKGLA